MIKHTTQTWKNNDKILNTDLKEIWYSIKHRMIQHTTQTWKQHERTTHVSYYDTK